MTTGLIGFAPIYINGLLALFFALVFPGLVFVRFIDISNFPQRWFVVVLVSLTANHLLVILIAALHLNPVLTYRIAAAVLVGLLTVLSIAGPAGVPNRSLSVASLSDLRWFALSLIAIGFAYFDIWKHGVPNIFAGGDISYSWNAWALIWAHGKFPTSSLGYPQFVPTIWAVTYILTGSTEQYFAFYLYLGLIIIPVALNAMNLGRINWWLPLVAGFVFVWQIAEIQEPWLKACLRGAFPDWVAAIFGFSGTVLFIANTSQNRSSKEMLASALISLCLLSVAAATKPIYGLFVVAALLATFADALSNLESTDRRRLMTTATMVVLAFVVAYALDYLHLAVVRVEPDYRYSLSERLFRALKLFNANFSLPFRIAALLGLAMSPFVPRIRWLALPLIAGVWLWAAATSYDLRNLLGLLLISAFIPLYVLARAYASPKTSVEERQWSMRDSAVALGFAVLCFAVTATLAKNDAALKQQFADEQLTKVAGFQINHKVGELLARGCTIFNSDNYLYTISAFEQFQGQLRFFFASDPLNDTLKNGVKFGSGCTAFFYPTQHIDPTVLAFISEAANAQHYKTVIEGNGMKLLVSGLDAPGSPQ